MYELPLWLVRPGWRSRTCWRHVSWRGFKLVVVVFGPRIVGFEMGVLVFDMGRGEWRKRGWFNSDGSEGGGVVQSSTVSFARGLVGSVRDGGVLVAVAAAHAAAATAPIDPLFDSSTASVTTSASASLSCSSSCSSLRILMGLTWCVCAVS